MAEGLEEDQPAEIPSPVPGRTTAKRLLDHDPEDNLATGDDYETYVGIQTLRPSIFGCLVHRKTINMELSPY